MKNPLFEIKDLRAGFLTFQGLAKVLNGVDFALRRGEKVGLIGESGCGKTTTMKIAMRILPMPPGRITSGMIVFKGDDLLKVNLTKVHGVSGISMIFQDPTAALNPVFTIGQQLKDVVKYATDQGKALTKQEVRDRAVSTLKDVAMPDSERIMKAYPFELSGGMRQRVCIAKALIGARDLLIADEPTTNLDVTIGDQILRLLQELVGKRRTSVVLISHAIGAVRNLVDRIYVMYAGVMIEVAETKELFCNPLHPYTQMLLAAVPRLTGKGIAKGIGGRPPNYLYPPVGCRFQPRCPYAMPICVEKPLFFDAGESHKVACFLFR